MASVHTLFHYILSVLFAHNASLDALEETDDITYLGTVGHLLPDLVDHIERAGLTMEQQTIRIGDMLLHLRVDAGLVHHRGVGTTIFQRFTTRHQERRNIVRERATSLDQ